MLVNLASTAAASVFASSPRPGVTGTLPVSKGGTGVTTIDSLKEELGISGGNGSFEFLYARAQNTVSFEKPVAKLLIINIVSYEYSRSNGYAYFAPVN